MPNPAAPAVTNNVVRITVNTLTNGVQCQTTHDFRDDTVTSVTLANLAAFANAFLTNFKTLYLACLSPLTVMTSVYAQELHFGTCPSTEENAGSDPGTAGATNLPLEITATIARFGNLKGRHGRGRWSMPAVPNTFITPATNSNILNATGLAAYQDLADAFNFSIIVGAVTYTPFISTRPVAPNVLVTNGVNIYDTTVRVTLGTARRRKPGRGI